MIIETIGSCKGLELIIIKDEKGHRVYGLWNCFPLEWISRSGTKSIPTPFDVSVRSILLPKIGSDYICLPGSYDDADGDLFLVKMDLEKLRRIILFLNRRAQTLTTTEIDNKAAVRFSNDTFDGTLFARCCMVGFWVEDLKVEDVYINEIQSRMLKGAFTYIQRIRQLHCDSRDHVSDIFHETLQDLRRLGNGDT